MWLRIVVGVGLALVLYFVGVIFGLNGPNWDWWQDAAWGAAALTLVEVSLVELLSDRVERYVTRFRGLLVSIGGAGLVVLVASLVVAGHSFNDSYYGSRVWPDALACVGCSGYVAALVAFGLLSSAPAVAAKHTV